MNRLFAIFLAIIICSCSAQREPGPGERIGKALDEMRRGIAELAPDETAAERRAREDREWRRRQDEYYKSSRVYENRNKQDDRASDIYSDKTQAERDKEFWDRPPEEETREGDRY